jgi:hypothetical protein
MIQMAINYQAADVKSYQQAVCIGMNFGASQLQAHQARCYRIYLFIYVH